MAPSAYANKTRKAAAKGSAEAQYAFALLHYNGEEGVRRDLIAAAEWMRKAARQGTEPGAQFHLGFMYYSCEAVERDVEQAMEWWRKVASQDPEGYHENKRDFILQANRQLAMHYDKGGGGGMYLHC